MSNALRNLGIVPTWELQDRLARARRHAGLEQGELAELAGVSRKSVSNWELGRTVPRRAAIIAIAYATGVSVEWLEYGETPGGNEPGGGGGVRHQGLEPRTHCLTLLAA